MAAVTQDVANAELLTQQEYLPPAEAAECQLEQAHGNAVQQAGAHIHADPSISDLLAFKRQRVKSLQSFPSGDVIAADADQAESPVQPQLDGSQQLDTDSLQHCQHSRPASTEPVGHLQTAASTLAPQEPCATEAPGHSLNAEAAGPRGQQAPGQQQGAEGQEQQQEVHLGRGFSEPFLPAVFGESMSAYFQRLRAAVGATAEAGGDGNGRWSPVTTQRFEVDGVYLHKRPIRAPNGSSPLAVCGSVMHHVVVYVKQGPQLHTLDFGPANGADVTANILEEAPPKRVLASGAVQDAVQEADAELPYMYLGPPARGLEHGAVQQLLAFAESRPYHALRNNCIHFADALVRVLTAGAVRGAPLLYDLYCGAVPPVDNPMLMMMQLMMRMSWFNVVDGSPLAAAFAEAWARQRAQSPPCLAPVNSGMPAAAGAAAPTAVAAAVTAAAAITDEEEAENNGANAATTATAAAAVSSTAQAATGADGSGASAVGALGTATGAAAAVTSVRAEGTEAGASDQLCRAESGPEEVGKRADEGRDGAREEEACQERANDCATEEATTAPKTAAADVEMAEAAASVEGEGCKAAGVTGAGDSVSAARAQPQLPVRMPSLPARKARKAAP